MNKKTTEVCKMLLSFNEAVKEYGNQYQLSQALAQQKVYKIEEGI